MKVFVLDLLVDLRDKRLWPVAALLAAALVAVPLLMLKPAAGEPASSGSVAAAAGGAKPARGPLVEAVDRQADDSSDLKVFGAKDPFRPRIKQKPGAGTATIVTPDSIKSAAPASTAGNGSAGSSAPGGTGSSPVGTTTPTTPIPAKPKTKITRYTYVVDVTFGRIGRLHRYRGLRRLSMLPREDSPLLISLGVDANADRAALLVNASLKAKGEGRCPPSGPRCTVLYLAAGSRETFTQSNGDSYLLRVDAIRKVKLVKAASGSRTQSRRATRSARGSAGRRLVPPVLADLVIVAGSAESGSRPASQHR